MSASTGALLTLLGGHDPMGVIFYRDDDSREDLVGLCKILSPKERPLCRTSAVEDAFREENSDTVLLITPFDEAEAVRTLEGQREKLRNRKVPAVLFLMQGGSAEDILNRQAPALSSFLRGLTYDPEPPANPNDLVDRRVSFERKHGLTPDEWLQAWQRDDVADTADHNLTGHEAWTLRTS